jgi:uncharacterized membrane protein
MVIITNNNQNSGRWESFGGLYFFGWRLMVVLVLIVLIVLMLMILLMEQL